MTEVERLLSDLAKTMPAIDQTEYSPSNSLWKGPEVDGVTVSLLSRWLADRERFRLLAILGLKGKDRFNHKLEYGNLWHIAEESFANEKKDFGSQQVDLWKIKVSDYARKLCRKYPYDQQEVDKWYRCCMAQFPLYRSYWARNAESVPHQPLFSEQVFDVTYTLPSGRKVRLRGKWDSADKTGDELWLQENKTKGRIDEQQILRQLKFDLQTMVYLIALKQEQLDSFWRRANKKWRDLPLAGVRYNVVRRPLSGGKGTIVRHKGTKNKPEESLESYYARLAQYIKDEPHTYFMRWNCRVGEEDIRRFKTESLDPILEQLCFWYDVVTKDGPDDPLPKYAINYRLPYFTFNPTLDGGITEYDEYLASGSMSMLEITHNLFPELTS
jgi:hypothetical protein